MWCRTKHRILKRGNTICWETFKDMFNISVIRVLQSKTALRSHLTIVRIQDQYNIWWHMLAGMQGKGTSIHPSIAVGAQASKATLEISVAVSQEAGINLSQDPAILGLGIYPKGSYIPMQRHLLMRGQCFSSHNVQKLKTVNMLVNWWLSDGDVVHLHNRTLLLC